MIFIVFYSMYFYVLLINMFVSTAIAQIDVYRFTWKWVNIVAEHFLKWHLYHFVDFSNL